MYNLVKRYMENLSIEQVNDFAKKNNVVLSEKELNFTYTFVKKKLGNDFSKSQSLTFRTI